jgi:hypothetical protein
VIGRTGLFGNERRQSLTRLDVQFFKLGLVGEPIGSW